MELASAQLQRPDKGEDAYIVRRLDDTGLVQLVAVADGLSLNDGKAAANWVINYLVRATDTDSPRAILEGLRRELSQSQCQLQSETTLTCGILRQIDTEHHTFLRFEYFAIGDSPIWKVVTGDLRYPFQRFLVHGTPYPAETARVYSTVRLQERDIQGGIIFGAIEIEHGEVLVVCTDGIPEREIFVRDISNMESNGAISLCRWLFRGSPYNNNNLAEVLANYDRRGVLFDDATIIIARLLPPPTKGVDSHNENSFALEAKTESAKPMPDLLTDAALLNVQPTNNFPSGKDTDLLSPTTPCLSASEGLEQEQGQVERDEIDPIDDTSTRLLTSTHLDSKNEDAPAQEEALSLPQSGITPDCVSRETEDTAPPEKTSATPTEDHNALSNEPSITEPSVRNRRRKNI
jgi:serine/threonine protein phosphatase PrpC